MLWFALRILFILSWMLFWLWIFLPSGSAHPLEELAQLRVEPEGSRCEGHPYHRYEREYDSYESDRGPDGLENRIVRAQSGIFSPYDNRWYDSIRETDIEHITAREQAHVSGLCRAEGTARIAYVHDLQNLTVATPRVNQVDKGARDFAHYRPPHNRCWMAATIVRTKYVWGLSVDALEKSALANQLHLCQSFEMHRRGRPEHPP